MPFAAGIKALCSPEPTGKSFLCTSMALQISSLNSGSNGNCYYIGNGEEALLVDAGISCKETEKRMAASGLSMQKVKAIFISHEHTDHISGLPVLARKYNLPIYISPATYANCGQQLPDSQRNWFTSHTPVQVGDMHVTAFSKKHDAADANSFTIRCRDTTVGVFTDIGEACGNVITHFKQCHAAFLESNYDEDMLENGRYPYYLKNRIRGAYGHLSNKQALDIFVTHRPEFMSHLLLAHLSKDNNDPTLVQSLFQRHAGRTIINVASRYQPSPVYNIVGSAPRPIPVFRPKPVQMCLFA